MCGLFRIFPALAAREKARFRIANSRLTSALAAPASWRARMNRSMSAVEIVTARRPLKNGRMCLRMRRSTSGQGTSSG